MRGLQQRGRYRAAAACLLALIVGMAISEAGAAAKGSASAPGQDTVAAAKKKKCKKGYALVKVKVKKKRGGKTVTVKVRKCRKVKKKVPALPKPTPTPTPTPSPGAATPRVPQILGWSTTAVDPDTPPGDLVANGGTISTCTTANSLSVYVRRTGFSAIGLVSHVWKRNGAVIASGTNSNTYEGAFRYTLTINPTNGLYELVWSSGGQAIASASITRNC